MLRDRTQVFKNTSVPINGSNAEFWGWLLRGSRLVAVKTPPGVGKTSLGVGLLVETIVRVHNRIPDVLRFRYISAPWAFQEIARTRYDKESEYEHNIRYAGMLVMDDLHMLDGKDLERAVYMIKLRSDDARSTVITGDTARMAAIFNAYPELSARVSEGRSITL